ncbi:hypothetical protein MRX96_059072 [Rhipicephalus microplus]
MPSSNTLQWVLLGSPSILEQHPRLKPPHLASMWFLQPCPRLSQLMSSPLPFPPSVSTTAEDCPETTSSSPGRPVLSAEPDAIVRYHCAKSTPDFLRLHDLGGVSGVLLREFTA